MSEVSNADVDSQEENGFSRRRVVKGVAWSLPVLVTAVGAPPASASLGKYEVLLDYASGRVADYVQLEKPTNGGQFHRGLGPTGFHVKNSSGIASGPISGTITISSVDTADPRVGVSSFPGGTLSNTSAPTAASFSTDFKIQAGVANGATMSFPVSFYYTGGNKSAGSGKQFNLSITFTSPAGFAPLGDTLKLN